MIRQIKQISKLFDIGKIRTGLLALSILLVGLLSAPSALAASSWHDVGGAGFSAGGANYASLAFSDGTPYVAYQDGGDGSKATVMKFDGTSWVTVGSAGFSAGQADYISLAIDNGIPYVAYRDVINSYKATVMKFNGTSWVTVGSAGFSAGESDFISLAVSNGTPYVAYEVASNGSKATVMKFDGTSWVTVGAANFSAGGTGYTSLAISGGTPYVAYEDAGNGYRATVMKFDGTSWVTVGSAGFSAGSPTNRVTYTSLAIDNGTPYVAYQDGGNAYRASVMKFDGTSWVTVGSAGFSAGVAKYTSLAIDNGTPYVAYQDGGNAYRASVMKFDGTSWVTVGSAGFSAGGVGYTSLAFSAGTPYVAYQDGGNASRASVMAFYDPSEVTLTNAITSAEVMVKTPAGSTITCSASVESSSEATKDTGYTYPLGLVNYCFNTGQSSNQVSLTFKTDLKPSDVVARKYDPVTKTYRAVAGAAISETILNGQPALKLTYVIEDNGPLDADSTIGVIRDPVGLAVAVSSASGSSNLGSTPGTPATGYGNPNNRSGSLAVYLALAAVIATVCGLALLRKKR